ncbi:MAG: CpaD family pilus assembly lipoprotein [Rhodospirillales bacterium]
MSPVRRPAIGAVSRLLTLLVVPVLIAACASGYQYREPKVTVVDSREDVAFVPGSATLPASAAAQLQDFLLSVKPADGGELRVFVVGAATVVGAPERTAQLIDRRNQAVADVLTANGIVAEPLPADAIGRSVAPDTVAVIARHTVVTLPACPDWSGWPNYSTFHNLPYSNWSCATAVNFGMMVADPSDLARGRVPGDADGTVMARSIENYRKGKTKPIMRDVSTADTYSAGGGDESGSSN